MFELRCSKFELSCSESARSTRMVKIIERLEKARLAASSCLLRLPFSAASIRPTIQLLLNSINREEQDGLGWHAGLHHPHRRSRAAVAERISGCGEPYPEGPRIEGRAGRPELCVARND